MTIRVLFLLFLGFSSITHAAAERGCPYPSSVKYRDGYFQGTGTDSPWRGSSVKAGDFLDTFSGAVFIPSEGHERKQGYLEKCIYTAGSGRSVALRYWAPDGPLSMSLTDTSHWRLATGPFDQEVYLCDDSQPDNCSFIIDNPKH